MLEVEKEKIKQNIEVGVEVILLQAEKGVEEEDRARQVKQQIENTLIIEEAGHNHHQVYLKVRTHAGNKGQGHQVKKAVDNLSNKNIQATDFTRFIN